MKKIIVFGTEDPRLKPYCPAVLRPLDDDRDSPLKNKVKINQKKGGE